MECFQLVADARGQLVAGDDAVANGDDAVGILGDVGLVGDERRWCCRWREVRRRGP